MVPLDGIGGVFFGILLEGSEICSVFFGEWVINDDIEGTVAVGSGTNFCFEMLMGFFCCMVIFLLVPSVQ